MADNTLTYRIQVDLFGIRTHCPPGYVHNRPKDSSYLFEYFETPVEILDAYGQRKHDGQTCIVYSPEMPQYYRADEPLIHTWFYAHGPSLSECMAHYDIPLDRAFRLNEPQFLIPFLDQVRRYSMRHEAYWEDAVTILCRTFFRNLSQSRVRARTRAAQLPSQIRAEDEAVIRRTRAQIHADIGRRWSVQEMAALVNLSPSQYTVLYRHYFQISPYKDLIDARIRYAEVLLRFSTLSLEEIAWQCGFANTSRLYDYYRRRTGRSAGDIIRTRQLPAGSAASRVTQDSEADRISLLFTDPSAYWSFDYEDGDPKQDFGGKQNLLVFKNGASIAEGRSGGGALCLDTSFSHAELPSAVVNTQRSFTVSAWVRHDLGAGRPDWMTAVSAGSEQHCSFYLQCCLRDGCYMFTVTPSALDFETLHARGTLSLVARQWVHLTGVHDSERRQIQLWENGVLSAALPFETPWKAPGPTRIGAAVFFGSLADLWHGMIDDVRLYDRALTGSEIGKIASFNRER